MLLPLVSWHLGLAKVSSLYNMVCACALMGGSIEIKMPAGALLEKDNAH